MRRVEPSPKARRFVAWTLRHGGALWVVALLLAVPATLRTATLYAHLESAIEQLLPEKAPSVIAIQELRRRMAGLQFLGVVVDTGTPENLAAGEALLSDLAARVRAYPPEMVRAVRTGRDVERRFLEANAPLYVDIHDLETVRARIEARRDYEVAKATGNDLEEGPPPTLDFTDLKSRYESKLTGGGGNLEGDRFSNKQLHTTVLLIEAARFSTGDTQKALVDRVKKDLASLGGTDHYAKGMRFGFSADVAISVEEVSALVADLSLSSVVVVVAVAFVIIVYFRFWQSIVILVVPLLLATTYSFALASLPPFRVSLLNSNTAFLGSIIVGNGINFGIILLARYAEERRKGVLVEEALVTAVSSARPGTLSAALAAGVSYAALAITEFRGFRQFGFIGGIGMVASWAVAFVLMPPLIAWLDRKGAMVAPRKGVGVVARLAPWVARFAVPITVVSVAGVAGAVFVVRGFDASQLEYDFSKLRRADTWTNGEGYWGGKMDAVLGQYLTPTVLMTDDMARARTLAAATRARLSDPSFGAKVSMVRSADDVLPTDQPTKIALVEAIRRDLTPRIRASLSPEDAKQVERFLGQPKLRPLSVGDLPATFTEAMLENDGSFGKTVLVFPRPHGDLWSGAPLRAFVDQLRSLAGTVSPPARVAGSLPLSSDIVTSIQRDGAFTSAAAFLGVVLVVVILFRGHPTTVVVVASLAVGVLFLFASSMLLGVKINFCNFIAFPITFGIGVDYSVNIMSRYVEDGSDDPVAAVRSTGGAVALCSLTTILGYSSLLLAQNRALYLFGLLAVLGEVCCLSTALVTMPAALTVFRRCRFRTAPSST